MKIASLSLFLSLFAGKAFASTLGVMIHAEDPELHPANACNAEDGGFVEAELAVAMEQKVTSEYHGGRNLQGAYCDYLCSQFPSKAYCWNFIPYCARRSGNYRALTNVKVTSDHSLACAKMTLAVEETLVKLADFVVSDSCRSALLDAKEYECFLIGDDEEE